MFKQFFIFLLLAIAACFISNIDGKKTKLFFINQLSTKYLILNLGRFIGDFPAEDPKKPCNVETDCTEENQTCHDMGRWGGFCGSKTCQTKTDCLEIGHVVHGIFSAIGCNDSLCEYSTSQAIA